LNYLYDNTGRPFPKLLLQLTNPQVPEQAVETDAYLDSGAERSLFKADLALAIGLDLNSGQRKEYGSLVKGFGVEARLHLVRLSHPELGDFSLEIGFTESPIGRNLLGRDFFSLIQIGFRERYLTFYVTPTP
jgi:hypothetical protein